MRHHLIGGSPQRWAILDIADPIPHRWDHFLMRLLAEKRPRDPAAGLAARAQRLLALVQNHALSLVTGVTLWATRSRQATKSR